MRRTRPQNLDRKRLSDVSKRIYLCLHLLFLMALCRTGIFGNHQAIRWCLVILCASAYVQPRFTSAEGDHVAKII
jgi:hypothetical protein